MIPMHPIGQHFLAGFDGFSVTDKVRELILDKKILGFTLFKWNVESATQLCALNDELKSLARQAGYDLILAVDQEGGRVQRLPTPFTKIPAMREWGKLCAKNGDLDPVFELGRILGREVRLAGFNLDFAPVVDVDTNGDSPIIGDRSFSPDKTMVVKCARQLIRGLIREGVIPCAKHFPGHGATSVDSHLALPVDTRGREEILAADVMPYRELMHEHLMPTVLTAHVLYPDIDPDYPATLSEHVIGGLLRGEMGYDGVVLTDDLLMQAIADNYDLTEAARRFFSIGGDVALVCKCPELCLEMISKIESDADANLKEKFAQSFSRLENLKRQFMPSLLIDGDVATVTKKHQDYLEKLFIV
jgi:beta-N-acetylhexosaminidase